MTKSIKQSKIDKSEWGEGPWQHEPDHFEWESQGFPCLMHRHPRMGHWCGYVAVSPGHPCFEKSYSAPWNDETNESEPNYPTDSLNVHGGLTYADHCNGDICHIPKPGQSDNVWWLGFDLAHAGDLSPANEVLYRKLNIRRFGLNEIYRDFDYVKNEVEDLAQQLANQCLKK